MTAVSLPAPTSRAVAAHRRRRAGRGAARRVCAARSGSTQLPRGLRHRCVQLPAGADRRRSRATSMTSSPRSACASRFGRAGPVPRRRHQPRRAVHQRGRDAGLGQIRERDRSSNRRRAAVRPGRDRARRAEQGAARRRAGRSDRSRRPTTTARSAACREQLLRRRRAVERDHGRQRSPLEVLTYDGAPDVGRPDDESPESRGSRGAGRRATFCDDPIASRSATAVSPNPAPDSGYNLPELLPENGFNVARALVGSESTCVTILRAELESAAEPTHSRLVLAGYDDIAAAARHVPLANESPALRPRRPRPQAHRVRAERRLNTVATARDSGRRRLADGRR